MKKLIIILFALTVLFSVTAAYASAEDMAAPSKLLVTSYQLAGGELAAGKTATLTVAIANKGTADAHGVTVTFDDGEADILPDATGTKYIEKIPAGKSATVTFTLTAVPNTENGNHKATLTIASSETTETQSVIIPVKQTKDVGFGAVSVPSSVETAGTLEYEIAVVNSGKSGLYSAVLSVSVEGADEVSTAVVGNLACAESKTAAGTFSVSGLSAGAHKGTYTVTATDFYGETVSASKSFSFTVKDGATVSADSSPRLMVTKYEVTNGSIEPDKSGEISITIENKSSSKAVKNIKLIFSDENDELRPSGMGTAYLESIAPGKSYVWKLGLTAVHTASTGEHSVTVAAEYEDEGGAALSVSDTLRISVKQPVKLEYDGAVLPAKVICKDTASVSVNLMNTGKCSLYNCMLKFEIDGLSSAGTVLVGTIAAGESAAGTANLRVDAEPGELSGNIIITYEDDFGNTYEKKAAVSTVAEERVETAQTEEVKENKVTKLWWLFIIIGALVGGAAGFGIPAAIRSSKQRKEDEKRL